MPMEPNEVADKGKRGVSMIPFPRIKGDVSVAPIPWVKLE
ncbi:hypothetical protein E2C01_095682 [Portunus trituberculatus]|uniref:Uncharacterized protein n=1 Tax=Portunus trituberculatus TaxID=210409 RepID=A0A5B7JQG2_PORTR|nr:hypothetical protein [Portunus trituberculatus]